MLYEIDEQPGVPLDDAQEVSRCVAALEEGLVKLRGGLPLCLRLLCRMHKVLLDHPRGRGKAPAEALAECLRDLERFLNDQPEATPPLLKAAFAHVQFETIHPFLDGNGRIDRLLIVLQLVADGVLREPMLYPASLSGRTVPVITHC